MIISGNNKIAICNLVILATTIFGLMIVSDISESYENSTISIKNSCNVIANYDLVDSYITRSTNHNRSFITSGDYNYIVQREAIKSECDRAIEKMPIAPEQIIIINSLSVEIKELNNAMNDLVNANVIKDNAIIAKSSQHLSDSNVNVSKLINDGRAMEMNALIGRYSDAYSINNRCVNWFIGVCIANMFFSIIILRSILKNKLK